MTEPTQVYNATPNGLPHLGHVFTAMCRRFVAHPDWPVLIRFADLTARSYSGENSRHGIQRSIGQFLDMYAWLGLDVGRATVICQSQREARYDQVNRDHFGGRLTWDWIGHWSWLVPKPPTIWPQMSYMTHLSRGDGHGDFGADTEMYGADHLPLQPISTLMWEIVWKRLPWYQYVPCLTLCDMKMSKSGRHGLWWEDVAQAEPARVWSVLSGKVGRHQTNFTRWPPGIEDQENWNNTLGWIPNLDNIEILPSDIEEMLE